MGPQRKHSEFFKPSVSRRSKTPAVTQISATNLSDSSFDRSLLDSDMPPESGMDMSDVQEPVFPKPACLGLQQRFERFKWWGILVQAIQARKYLLDGLQAGL